MPSIDSCTSSSSLAPSKPFSISLSSKPKPGKPAPASPSITTLSALSSAAARKRPHSALADLDSDLEDTSASNNRHEAVVGFGDDGKIISVSDARNQKKQPLVIKTEKNRDWRGGSRRKRGNNLLPAEVRVQQEQRNGQGEAAGTVVERSEVSIEGGLKTVQQREAEEDVDVVMKNAKTNGEEKGKEEKMIADEEAIAALLGGEKKKSTLTIPSSGDKAAAETNSHDLDPDGYSNEAERFRADVESRPSPASLADYAAVPVEEFGAAILRGLGWKEGEAIGKTGHSTSATPREVKRRPALLGIGAKETPGGVAAEELGAWNQKKGRGKQKVAYNPVMLRNSVTGEMVTEEEMELRKVEARQGKGKVGAEADWRERRETNLKIDEGRKRERLAIENGGEKAINGSSRRERDRERDNKRDRRRERDSISSRKETNISTERSKHGSSTWVRSRSSERKHWRRGDDYDHNYDQQNRDTGSGPRERDREHERHDRRRDYDNRDRDRAHKRR